MQGEVLLLLSSSFSVVKVYPSDIPPNSCEFLSVLDEESGICRILIYRPPDVSIEDTRLLFRSIHAILSLHPTAIVLGDFNHDERPSLETRYDIHVPTKQRYRKS